MATVSPIPIGLRFDEEEILRAWERVEENDGCAGADGVSIMRFRSELESNLRSLRETVASGEYRFLPLLQILVEKKAGSAATRRLLVPVVAGSGALRVRGIGGQRVISSCMRGVPEEGVGDRKSRCAGSTRLLCALKAPRRIVTTCGTGLIFLRSCERFASLLE